MYILVSEVFANLIPITSVDHLCVQPHKIRFSGSMLGGATLKYHLEWTPPIYNHGFRPSRKSYTIIARHILCYRIEVYVGRSSSRNKQLVASFYLFARQDGSSAALTIYIYKRRLCALPPHWRVLITTKHDRTNSSKKRLKLKTFRVLHFERLETTAR